MKKPTESKPSEGARRLAALMKKRGLSQEDVAEALHVNAATVCRWVGEKRRPDAVSISRIESALGIPASLWGQPPFAPSNDEHRKAG